MIYGIYSVRDIKSGFTAPMLDLNDESAIRNFKDSCLNVKLNPSIFYNPADYSIYKLGTYDTEAGKIDVLPERLYLEEAYTFVNERDYTPFVVYREKQDENIRKEDY